jgi:hypothetical protein
MAAGSAQERIPTFGTKVAQSQPQELTWEQIQKTMSWHLLFP